MLGLPESSGYPICDDSDYQGNQIARLEWLNHLTIVDHQFPLATIPAIFSPRRNALL